MTGCLWLAAGGVLLAAGWIYFRGAFRLATALALGYWALAGMVVCRSLPPVPAVIVLALLVAIPAALLALHMIDARKGLFLIPTIYAIPLAFLTAILLWLVAGATWITSAL